MSNLTITIDDELLRDARVKAVQEGTSVNAICRQAIDAFVRRDDASASAAAHARADAFVEHARRVRRAPVRGAASGRPPSRDDLYDEVLSDRLPRLWPARGA